MQSPQAKLKDITRLLASWPSAGGEGDETLHGYLMAAEDYHADDVTAAVNALITGSAPGVNPAFLPPPAVLGAEIRRQLNLRLDHERRERLANPRLPAPDIEHTPEERARVKARVDAFVADMADKYRTDDATAQLKAERWGKVNGRFAPDMDVDAMYRRLISHVSAGDPDGDRDAA